MPKTQREFLKAYEWSQFEGIKSDQVKGLPRPDLQKRVPEADSLKEQLLPDQLDNRLTLSLKSDTIETILQNVRAASGRPSSRSSRTSNVW